MTGKDRILQLALTEYLPIIRQTLYRYTRNRSDIDELMQETFARIFCAPEKAVMNVRSERAFVLTVTRNVALDWYRRRQIVIIQYTPDMELLDVTDDGADLENGLHIEQEIEKLLSGIADLPLKCGQVFVMCHIMGLTQKEASQAFGISENTVEQHLTRASRMLAASMGGTLWGDRREGEHISYLRGEAVA